MNYTKQHGFTLIELMIVIAIIGILASIAIPAYSQYVNKAKYSEVINAVAATKIAVEACAAKNGTTTNFSTTCSQSTDSSVQDAVNNSTGGEYVNAATAVGGIIVGNTVNPANGVDIVTISFDGDNTVFGDFYHYRLQGQIQNSGGVVWTLDPASTCIAQGLC